VQVLRGSEVPSEALIDLDELTGTDKATLSFASEVSPDADVVLADSHSPNRRDPSQLI